jgi:hypothetical protein
MPKITFRGKTYYSEFEMPPNVRRAYQKEQIHRTNTKPLTDVVDMPAEVEDVYRRALDREEQSNSAPSTKDLPTTEDLYRQSAPADMRHLPSDESIYQPSAPVIDPDHSTIEPDSGPVLRGLAIGVVCALVIMLIVFLIIQFLR